MAIKRIVYVSVKSTRIIARLPSQLIDAIQGEAFHRGSCEAASIIFVRYFIRFTQGYLFNHQLLRS
jgi:hypothetical protein